MGDKQAAVQAYLDKFNVRDRLEDALNKCVKATPDDPFAFIAGILNDLSSSEASVAKVIEAPPLYFLFTILLLYLEKPTVFSFPTHARAAEIWGLLQNAVWKMLSYHFEELFVSLCLGFS